MTTSKTLNYIANNNKQPIIINGYIMAGKTTALHHLAKVLYDNGKKVLFVSGEDTIREACKTHNALFGESASMAVIDFKITFADAASTIVPSTLILNSNGYDAILIDDVIPTLDWLRTSLITAGDDMRNINLQKLTDKYEISICTMKTCVVRDMDAIIAPLKHHYKAIGDVDMVEIATPNQLLVMKEAADVVSACKCEFSVMNATSYKFKPVVDVIALYDTAHSSNLPLLRIELPNTRI